MANGEHMSDMLTTPEAAPLFHIHRDILRPGATTGEQSHTTLTRALIADLDATK
jgi:hypothetical protein